MTDPRSVGVSDATRTDVTDQTGTDVSDQTRIHVTDAALEAMREMASEAELPEEGGLRLSARSGAGCSAPLKYGMTLEPTPEAGDRILESRGVRIFMDPESAWVLDGLVVDYVTSSPMGEGFAFHHPRGPGGRAC